MVIKGQINREIEKIFKMYLKFDQIGEWIEVRN